jgi:2-amino-4-hydroxy-6-hydroxymethyldihydropteridine diphosphokinase
MTYLKNIPQIEDFVLDNTPIVSEKSVKRKQTNKNNSITETKFPHSNNTVFIALGSNLGNRKMYMHKSMQYIKKFIGSITTCSPIYQSIPLLPQQTDDIIDFSSSRKNYYKNYLNAVIQVSTELDAFKILSKLLLIETTLGRERNPALRWLPRTIDLDLLFFNNLCINSTELTIPHPEIIHRDFVLIPLADITPELIHPLYKKNVKELLKDLTSSKKQKFVI